MTSSTIDKKIALVNSTLNALFNKAVANNTVKDDIEEVSTLIKSSSNSNAYAWLSAFPSLREWVGDRDVKDILSKSYVLENKTFESTSGFSIDDIDDNKLNATNLIVDSQVEAVYYDIKEMIFKALNQGETLNGYDEVPFFGDHTIKENVDGTGADTVYQNLIASKDLNDRSAGWYLLDCSRAVNPIVLQERQTPTFQVDTTEAFKGNQLRYGTKWRGAVGYGLWQMAIKSNQDLTKDNFIQARTQMRKFARNGNKMIGVKPTHLIVPLSLEAKAEELIQTERITTGSNSLYNSVKVIVSEQLNDIIK